MASRPRTRSTPFVATFDVRSAPSEPEDWIVPEIPDLDWSEIPGEERHAAVQEQAHACAQLVAGIIWQAIVDCCATPERIPGETRFRTRFILRAESLDAFDFLFGGNEPWFDAYAAMIGWDASGMRLQLHERMQTEGDEAIGGISGARRINFRFNWMLWERFRAGAAAHSEEG